MAKPNEVLEMLCPGVEWSLIGDNYENINWFGQKPAVTRKQYEDGFAGFDAWQAKQELDKATAKAALLDRLGITADEAKLLLS
jgi:hypothetical protein